MKFKLDKTCGTCEFNFSGICAGHGDTYKYNDQITDLFATCDGWGASFNYYEEICKNAPWYIKDYYDRYKIGYSEFFKLMEKDEKNEPIDINFYDLIEHVYNLKSYELAEVLGVSSFLFSAVPILILWQLRILYQILNILKILRRSSSELFHCIT